MKIAILGTRGIPANYGGFETFAEQLSTRLVRRGHEVTVYGRKHYASGSTRSYQGVNLVVLPTIRHKYFDTVIHTFLSVLHAIFFRYDIILICNAANSIFALLPRLFGTPTLVNVDGLERKRKKWNWLGRKYYLVSEWLSTFLPTAIVTDAQVIQDYYATRYHKHSAMIAYGADVERRVAPETLFKFGLKSNQYILYVSRLEPENNAHLVIEAYEKVETDLPLVIVGGAPYAEEYIAQLKSTKDKRVKFLGFVFGEDYRALQQNAYCYVHATEVGGTHPALIEAMGAGNCALVLNTPENLEVMGNAGISYDSVDDLAVQMRRLLAHPSIISEYRARAMARVRARYDWEQITNQYEWLLGKLAGLETAAEPLPLLAREVNVKEVEPLSYPVTTFAESRVVEVSRRAAMK
ncbi:MAG TPA: glycosyltransferase [Blastocatellia bacterium]|nr:glycosyltransferase [Blastocatellia bacterium]